MTTIYQEILTELEHNPHARERRFRKHFIKELVLRRMGYEGQMFIPVDKLEDYGTYFESYMREHRHVQQDHDHLKGQDWSDKEVLEQEKELSLGYEPGYHENIKRLATIAN